MYYTRFKIIRQPLHKKELRMTFKKYNNKKFVFNLPWMDMIIRYCEKINIRPDEDEVKDNITNVSIYFIHNNKIYRFPYGNVNSYDNFCLDQNFNQNNIKIVDAYINYIITSEFNDDYNLHLYSHDYEFYDDIDLDLDHIRDLIEYNARLNIIQLLSYLEQEPLEKIDFDKIFIRKKDLFENVPEDLVKKWFSSFGLEYDS